MLGRRRPRRAPRRGSARTTSAAERWQKAADEIHADICANGVDDRGVFTQHYETDALDASVLLMPLMRFLPADDERIRATVLAIADELTEDGLVLRYRVEETDDGLSRRGGHVHDLLLLARLGAVRDRRDRRGPARCARSSSPTPARCVLYAEEIDPRTGRHLGNFPQAFTHLALINAVMHVIRADQQVEMRRVLARSRARAAADGPLSARVRRPWTACGWRRLHG